MITYDIYWHIKLPYDCNFLFISETFCFRRYIISRINISINCMTMAFSYFIKRKEKLAFRNITQYGAPS